MNLRLKFFVRRGVDGEAENYCLPEATREVTFAAFVNSSGILNACSRCFYTALHEGIYHFGQ